MLNKRLYANSQLALCSTSSDSIRHGQISRTYITGILDSRLLVDKLEFLLIHQL